MKEYKMRRGEYLEERMPDLEAEIEEFFGAATARSSRAATSTSSRTRNPSSTASSPARSSTRKKDKLAVDFVERPAEDVIAEGNADAAADAVDAKNDFLYDATGRDAKSRRDSMKRSVEDDAEKPDNAP